MKVNYMNNVVKTKLELHILITVYKCICIHTVGAENIRALV